MDGICVGELRTQEIESAMELVRGVFHKYVAPGYSEAGVREFETYIAPAAAKTRLAEGAEVFLGAKEEGALVGVLAYRLPPHISLLFVHPAYHNRGIARRLVRHMEETVKAAGFAEIDVNSSPYAVGVYQRLGYAPTGEETVVNGIRFIPMLKRL